MVKKAKRPNIFFFKKKNWTIGSEILLNHLLFYVSFFFWSLISVFAYTICALSCCCLSPYSAIQYLFYFGRFFIHEYISISIFCPKESSKHLWEFFLLQSPITWQKCLVDHYVSTWNLHVENLSRQEKKLLFFVGERYELKYQIDWWRKIEVYNRKMNRLC